MSTLDVYGLGTVPYEKALAYQRTLLERRIAGKTRDCLVLLEHPPTITTGRRGNTEHLLVRREHLEKHGIAFHRASRGGDITFHGPGQLVGYPVLNLKDHGTDVRGHMRKLERVIMRSLLDFGIEGGRMDGATGVWAEGSKIASIGIAIRKWVTYHGFALNVNTDLDYFDLIVSCGITDVRITSVKSLLGGPEDMKIQTITDCIIKNFMEIFNFGDLVFREEEEIVPER